MDNKIAFLLFELSVSIPNGTATEGKQNSQRLKPRETRAKHPQCFNICIMPSGSSEWLGKNCF